MMKHKKKPLYVVLIKAKNKVVISKTKQYIAELAGIHTITITRNMQSSDVYSTNEYTIWKNVEFHKDNARNHSGGKSAER